MKRAVYRAVSLAGLAGAMTALALAACAQPSPMSPGLASLPDASPNAREAGAASADASPPLNVRATDTVGAPGANDLVLVADGVTSTVVVVSPQAGPREKAAATELVVMIERMSGARLKLADTTPSVSAALAGNDPLVVVGEEALRALPALGARLTAAAKKSPRLGADAIALRRVGQRLYVAGNNDPSHAYAVAYLLREWGCRWFMPTAFGESIPEQRTLKVGALDYAYGSPFEVRRFWIAWNGSTAGADDFSRRNFFGERRVSGGHTLEKYLKDVVPPERTALNGPIAGEFPANYVAAQVAPLFAKGQDFSLGMDDGTYDLYQRRDLELRANVRDKYALSYSVTDNFLDFYNRVSEQLLRKYPTSPSRIGFLAYSNATIPPQRDVVAAKPLFVSLAPIDIDPVHALDDPRAPARQEYRDMLRRWVKVMDGRVTIYDYDQSMIVWRDVPNPSIQAFRRDAKTLAREGALGVDTESRSAIATTFFNLYLRGQLLWNPEADVDELLRDFYARFYGPAASAMSQYWGEILGAWERSIVTEHHHFAIPALYPRPLVARLRRHLEAAEAALRGAEKTGRDAPQYAERLRFTRLGFEVLDGYTSMVASVATDADYVAGVAAGARGLAARQALAQMNPTFVNTKMGESTAAWWTGEVEQYRAVLARLDGTRGTLVQKLPVEWAFHRDPHDTGVMRGYAYEPIDLAYWTAHAASQTPETRKDYPTTEWEQLRTDLYAQAQGVLHPDWQSYTGYLWYRTELTLTAEQAKGPIRALFPGIFNEGWLYVNGGLVGYRLLPGRWWTTDFRFEWEVDVSAALKPGVNTIAVRLYNPHHFGGIFRRPVLYRPR
ncbi:MAG: DUF4838 domain-containing protein [Myxococcales bacterium]|nr:DUF4838 domain-containing protein [Myxococcales bacterium]HQY64315.1 DUF4838 domain-containing protein [Polyangiaceae bacterium]